MINSLKKLNILTTPGVEEDRKKLNTADESVNWHNHFGK